MTAAVLTRTNAAMPPWNGASIILGWGAQHTTHPGRQRQPDASLAPMDFYAPAGVSRSANAIGQIADDSIMGFQAWPALPVSMPGVEYAPTDAQPKPDVFESLVAAARYGDERAFVSACNAIDWQIRSADEMAQTIHLALSAGAHLAARDLALQGARRFPDHPEIQRYARVLAPPKVKKSTLPTDSSLIANRDWLATRGHSYRGKWVGLRNGQLLGSASSLAALTKQIGDTKGVLLTRVF